MKKRELQKKVLEATKWSTATELISKLSLPIINMILSRLLLPEIFGIVTSVNIIITFAEMLSDAGFQKFLIQHDFSDKEDIKDYFNVAFTTNILISMLIFISVFFFRSYISMLLGISGLEMVLVIACIQIPLYSFSSIYISLYRRNFNFKSYFYIRTISSFIPFFVTIPLALLGLKYWSLIIGSTVSILVTIIFLIFNSGYVPKIFFKISILKTMISYSLWSLIESISIWLTGWVDIFILNIYISDNYVIGLYKNTISMVNGIMSVITASITPILFSGLSRLQNNEKDFNELFLFFQKIVAYLVLPLGVGLYLYKEDATMILLGKNWLDGAEIFGIWGLVTGFVIVLSHFNSEVFRAKGKPKISFIVQISHLAVLIPTLLIAVKKDFRAFIYTRAFVRFQIVLVSLIILKTVFGFSIFKIFKNILYPLICTSFMVLLSLLLKTFNSGFIWNLISIFLCIIVYFVSVFVLGKSDIKMFKETVYQIKNDS